MRKTLNTRGELQTVTKSTTSKVGGISYLSNMWITFNVPILNKPGGSTIVSFP